MPTIITRGAASATSLGFGAAAGGGNFISRIETVISYRDKPYEIVEDSNGNLITAGRIQISGADRGNLTSVNSLGDFRYQKNARPSGDVANFGDDTRDGGVAVDSSNNVYAFGDYTGSSFPAFFKFDSSGSFTSGIRLSGGSSINKFYFDGTHFYLATTASSRCIVVKLTTSFSIVWQKRIQQNIEYYPEDIFVDGSENVYVCGAALTSFEGSPTGGATVDPMIVKLTSSGSLSWARKINNPAGDFGGDNFRSIAVDSSGNVYCLGDESTGSGVNRYIVKVNSSGTLQSTTKYNTPYALQILKLDSAGNLFGSGVFNIVKFNSSFSETMRLELTSSDSFEIANFNLNSSGNIIGCGYGEFGNYIFKIPNDGTKTGTYTVGGKTFTYSSVATGSTSSLSRSLTSVSPTIDNATFTTTSISPSVSDTSGTAAKIVF